MIITVVLVEHTALLIVVYDCLGFTSNSKLIVQFKSVKVITYTIQAGVEETVIVKVIIAEVITVKVTVAVIIITIQVIIKNVIVVLSNKRLQKWNRMNTEVVKVWGIKVIVVIIIADVITVVVTVVLAESTM